MFCKAYEQRCCLSRSHLQCPCIEGDQPGEGPGTSFWVHDEASGFATSAIGKNNSSADFSQRVLQVMQVPPPLLHVAPSFQHELSIFAVAVPAHAPRFTGQHLARSASVAGFWPAGGEPDISAADAVLCKDCEHRSCLPRRHLQGPCIEGEQPGEWPDTICLVHYESVGFATSPAHGTYHSGTDLSTQPLRKSHLPSAECRVARPNYQLDLVSLIVSKRRCQDMSTMSLQAPMKALPCPKSFPNPKIGSSSAVASMLAKGCRSLLDGRPQCVGFE